MKAIKYKNSDSISQMIVINNGLTVETENFVSLQITDNK